MWSQSQGLPFGSSDLGGGGHPRDLWDGVLVVCGMRHEASILAGADRISVCGDASTLKRRLGEAAGSKPRLVISWGICGELDPRLRPGDLVVGAEVWSAEESIRTDERVTSLLAGRLAKTGARVTLERVAGAAAPVLRAGDKARLRHATGAAAVDMESLIAGRFARERDAPFAILRAVADPAERHLPPLVAKALDSEGRLNAASIVAGFVRSPGLVLLSRVARDSRAAFLALERCRSLLPGLFLSLGLPDL